MFVILPELHVDSLSDEALFVHCPFDGRAVDHPRQWGRATAAPDQPRSHARARNAVTKPLGNAAAKPG
jgi:hypothetical protein